MWQEVVDNEPITVTGWDDVIKESGLHLKWPEQIGKMSELKQAQIPRLERMLAEVEAMSNTRVVNQPGGGFIVEDWTDERAAEIAELERKIKRGHSLIKLCRMESKIRTRIDERDGVVETPDRYKNAGTRLVVDKTKLPNGVLPASIQRSPIGTTFFIDADNGNDSNDGLGTGTAWLTWAQYTTTTARSAGDIAISRNGTTGRYEASDTGLAFDESGTADNFITLEADYDNAFSTDVDLSATATATFTFGSKTVTYSSDISGVLSANDWIYEVNDDQREFAYEVASVSTVTVTLFLPYKGGNAGSGKTTTNMLSFPVYGTVSSAATRLQEDENFWVLQGLDVRHNNAGDPCFEMAVVNAVLIKDCIGKTGAAAFSYFIDANAGDLGSVTLRKCRTEGMVGMADNMDNAFLNSYDCLFSASGNFIQSGAKGVFNLFDCEFTGGGDLVDDSDAMVTLRNPTFTSIGDISSTSIRRYKIRIEDYANTPSDTRTFDELSTDVDFIAWQSETTIVRSGGSTISSKVTPRENLGTVETSRYTIIEIPIFTDTTSRTYELFFRTENTTDFTDDPTAAEFFMEFEGWGSASNNHRLITKSTGVIDFNGSTAWQSLSVTVATAQAGVAYLRVYYGKTKEGGKSNIFFMDPLVVIS